MLRNPPPRRLTTQSWKAFWEDYPASVDEYDFLAQVGHTIDGRPYSTDQLDQLVRHAAAALRLGPQERLLDVCCGNGVITSRLAECSGYVLGLDFSQPLINIAQRHHAAENIRYVVMDAKALQNAPRLADGPFTRAVVYAALQHFRPEDLSGLLQGIRKQLAPGGLILLGAVLDAERKHHYLDTPEKRTLYEQYRRDGVDRLGTWWDKHQLRSECEAVGLHCAIDDVDPERTGGRYRFDAIIT